MWMKLGLLFSFGFLLGIAWNEEEGGVVALAEPMLVKRLRISLMN